MDFHVIIPARLNSSRLPHKVLLDIAGKPMVWHTYQAALQSGATTVTIATDDDTIANTAKNFGATVVMTSPAHTTGTDRIHEALQLLKLNDEAIIVGLQADEPLLPAILIQQVAENVETYAAARVATLSMPIATEDEWFNPNDVKVVTDCEGYALYFSRAPIPWDRAAFNSDEESEYLAVCHRHIGLYAYRAGFLKEYVAWEKPDIELCESLEQLRILWHGAKIHVAKAWASPGRGVDTEEDLAYVRTLF